jgi:hypothetical protein
MSIPTVATDDEMRGYIANIIGVYNRTSLKQREKGRNWYPVAHDLAEMVGQGDVYKGAGIIAALSANKRWEINVGLARDAGEGNVHGHTKATLRKVEAMLDGADPREILPMQLKTGNFFRCIADPEDPDPVVIDRHAHDVAVGEVYGERDRLLGNTTRYATLALAYRLAAREVGEIPQGLQAITWVRWIEDERGHK